MKQRKFNMSLPKEIPAKEARHKFGEVMDRARYGHTPYLVKKGGKPMIVILGVEDYEDLLDAIDTMTEQASPEFQAALKKSHEAYRGGEVGTTDDIRKILRVKEYAT